MTRLSQGSPLRQGPGGQAPARTQLPARRPSANLKLRWGKWAVHVGAGYCPATGRLLEILIAAGKTGVDLQLAAHDAAAVVSIALQHGVPLAALAGAIERDGAGQPVSLLGLVLDAVEKGAGHG